MREICTRLLKVFPERGIVERSIVLLAHVDTLIYFAKVAITILGRRTQSPWF